VADGKYWLFYTAVPKPFINDGPKITKTAIGIAVSNSPDGPWKKLETNPILKASDNPNDFDSLRIDDACLIVRDGKYWMYYKGRQWNNTPGNTKMGVAIADKPEGPYLKNRSNPIIRGGHEVLVWPYGEGVVALIGTVGPKQIAKSLQYAPDGLSFSKILNLKNVPHAAGAYRLSAFTDNEKDTMIQWGVHIGSEESFLPFLERFDYRWEFEKTAEPGTAGDGLKPAP
jgi:beta-xylosidase